jgi:hypothetical protein
MVSEADEAVTVKADEAVEAGEVVVAADAAVDEAVTETAAETIVTAETVTTGVDDEKISKRMDNVEEEDDGRMVKATSLAVVRRRRTMITIPRATARHRTMAVHPRRESGKKALMHQRRRRSRPMIE